MKSAQNFLDKVMIEVKVVVIESKRLHKYNNVTRLVLGFLVV
jgi:hypothetical protein